MFIRILVLILLSYGAIHALIVLMQRSLVFLPSREAPGENKPEIAERVRIRSEDGVELEAWWIGEVPQPSLEMTLLYCHGNGATLGQLSHVAQIFHSLGLRALLFDYRGYGASEIAPLSEDAVMRDARAAYDWLVNEKSIPEDRIVVWGHSLGAAVASRLSVERSPAALITEGAFPSLYEMARFRYPWLLLHPSFLFDRFTTAAYLAERSMPLLMLHAERDSVIPLSLGQRAFSSAREPKQWLLISGMDHNDFPSVESQYREKIRGFIKSVAVTEVSRDSSVSPIWTGLSGRGPM